MQSCPVGIFYLRRLPAFEIARHSYMATIPYQYDPLDHQVGSIRLITIQPSPNRSAKIECTIAYDNIGKAQYRALSYTWGSPDDKQTISLNGRPFQVTKNLFMALERLRNEKEPLTLWIDAICINQEDDDERTHQVRQMTEIYKKATQVFVWMGEEIKNLEAAISLMHRLKQCMDKGGFGIEGLAGLAESKHRAKGWEALTELLKRPWWSRIWILQEAVFGNDLVVVCGRHRFS